MDADSVALDKAITSGANNHATSTYMGFLAVTEDSRSTATEIHEQGIGFIAPDETGDKSSECSSEEDYENLESAFLEPSGWSDVDSETFDDETAEIAENLSINTATQDFDAGGIPSISQGAETHTQLTSSSEADLEEALEDEDGSEEEEPQLSAEEIAEGQAANFLSKDGIYDAEKKRRFADPNYIRYRTPAEVALD